MRSLQHELSAALVGGRVERIHQPDREDLVILVYTPAGRHRLFVSVRPDMPRCYLTTRTWENPPSPPFFCQLLRRHLEGARITSVEQAGIDRILNLAVLARDEVGRLSGKRLILELTGRKSNVVLVGDDDRIIDAVKRVDSEDNRYREIWPGVPYLPPPPLDKTYFGAADAPFLTAAAAKTPQTSAVRRLILDHLAGLGPVVADEICLRAGADPATPIGESAPGLAGLLARELAHLAGAMEQGQFHPSLVEAGGKIFWAATELVATKAWLDGHGAVVTGHQGGVSLHLFDNASSLLDFYYARVEEADRNRRLADRLAKVIATEKARVERRLAAQGENLSAAAEADRWRALGEAILANLHEPSVAKGQSKAVLTYYAADGAEQTAEVPLNPSLGPSDNAQAYFHRYARARSTQREGQIRYDQGRRDLQYLESLEEVLDRLREEGRERPEDLSGLKELEAEMAAEGFLGRAAAGGRPQGTRGKDRGPGGNRAENVGGGQEPRSHPDRARGRAKTYFGARVKATPPTKGQPGKSLPGKGKSRNGRSAAEEAKDAQAPRATAHPYLRFELPGGFVALVGRNNRENDNLTLKVANPGDLWLHTKDIPGSHVILRSAAGSATEAVPDAALERAAELAAYHSKARHSSKVAVDYTERRHVRKPSGARPGMVIYDHHQTVYVEPRAGGEAR